MAETTAAVRFLMPTRPDVGLDLLAVGADDDLAITTAERTMTRAELRDRVDDTRRLLGDIRRLVFVSCTNTVDSLVAYLAAVAGGHPVLLLDGSGSEQAEAHRRNLVDRFDPDVIVDGSGEGDVIVDGSGEGDGGLRFEERRPGTRHALHPELAMLTSTSGSTGSPKLVRLSRRNLKSNAASIAEYLGLRSDDRAATTLPMHYCYGLSVINSHLLAGASVHLTARSVVDPLFWREFDHVGATSFAGVPYTFELLSGAGFADHVPATLRHVTQAGGRLPADAVRHYAGLGRDHDFRFFVMYGQTEATARMAYLPPELAEARAGTIGVPIPGGSFRIDGDDEGELVYSGPNVMMGYAGDAGDFALGQVLTELRTGDIARQHDDGLYEIVGRSSRFVKTFGLRVSLDRVEELLLEAGIDARAVACDERLAVFVRAERFVPAARDVIVERLGLPAHAFAVHAVDRFPRTASGKPDDATLVAHARRLEQVEPDDATAPASERIRELYAELLGRPDATADDSFVSLDGDSLSYVEVSVRLGRMLGTLPRDWPERGIRELAALVAPEPRATTAESAEPAGTNTKTARPRRRPRTTSMETSVLLRAAAIVLIVATHTDFIDVKGGAHLLLAVAGYNLVRFRVTGASGAARVTGLLRAAAWIAVPAVIWIGGVAMTTGFYDPSTAALLNGVLGQQSVWSEQWQFWFLEAIIWTLVGVAALLAIPWVDRFERRHPFGLALILLAVAFAVRVLVIGGIEAERVERYAVLSVVAFVVLGWLIARADTLTRRLIASAAVLVVAPGFFGEPLREAIVVAGCLLLCWMPVLRVPRVLVPTVVVLAASSMYVYLTHWQVYPPIEEVSPALATLASFAVGIVVWWLARVAGQGIARMTRASAAPSTSK
ncbi:AMP-binding protein [Agromyces albus]|uniref:AMP-binding protein n=1 Tax=Agromyces albus TaxID=205332 RepID=UPI002788FFAB|nr:AMP-binding protein [Agromyces albus]MDQ0576447.1 acyl-coenzyme A synthetase/AMP-(fatty) acid ligase [Agromyces albus]